MLSAYAARQNTQKIPTKFNESDLSDSDADLEQVQTVVDASKKRKVDTLTTQSSSRKRKKVTTAPKQARYYEKFLEDNVIETPPVTSTRSYSPSLPITSGEGAEIMDHSLSISPTRMSTFMPRLNDNVFIEKGRHQIEQTRVTIIMKPSETLSFLGTIALTLLYGQVTLFGSTIIPSPTRHMIYAPINYPTATIEASIGPNHGSRPSLLPPEIAKRIEPVDSVLVIEDSLSGVEGLNLICGGNHNTKFHGFSDFPFAFELHQFFPASKIIINPISSSIPMQIPTSWRSGLQQIDVVEGHPRILIKGAKNSGKSMFSRMLINHLLLRYQKVAYLECDPGQTEFTPPGLVSLHIIDKPIFGPPFTHPRHALKAHFTGSTSVKSLSSHYLKCVKALLETYNLDIRYEEDQETFPMEMNAEMARPKGVPLVINTFGWTKGLGGELIRQIESQADLTHLISLGSHTGDLIRANEPDIDSTGLYFISLEPVDAPQSNQNQADKRSLMIMSYFHSQVVEGDNINGEYLRKRWITDTPLCAMAPWEVSWATALDHIILIGNGSEDVDGTEVLRVLNGALIALVEIYPSSTEKLPLSQSSSPLPYTQGAGPPDPTISQCLGYALVRSVRASTGALHIITPVPADRLARARALVMGEIHLPIWGMLDHRADSERSGLVSAVDLSSAPFLYWTDIASSLPGSRRLRVRRNLMRKSQI
ncbi:hypothetical protein CPB86DRAFT_803579 [Serendipita vermifera]|nr:hypothetical protein CPB86DRAFT_803579 [Serendipita vermifera]